MSKKYLISGTVTPHKIEVVLNKMKFLGMEGIWTENNPIESTCFKHTHERMLDIPDIISIKKRYEILLDASTVGIVMIGETWSQTAIYSTEYNMAKNLNLHVLTEKELDNKILCKVSYCDEDDLNPDEELTWYYDE